MGSLRGLSDIIQLAVFVYLLFSNVYSTAYHLFTYLSSTLTLFNFAMYSIFQEKSSVAQSINVEKQINIEIVYILKIYIHFGLD